MAFTDALRSIWQQMGAPAASRVTSLGYHAIEETDKRRLASPNLRSEDTELQQSQRQQLNAQAQDCMRNFSICRWAVGKHLDFVARHSFISSTGNDTFDRNLQDLMEEYSNEPKLCDVMGRHTLDRIVRMTEARAVLSGDHLLLKLNSEQLQQVESDRLRSEIGVGVDGSEVHGVQLNRQGRATAYKIWDRDIFGGYSNPKNVPADGVICHGYFPSERSDQVRGIGLVTAGLTDFCDAYEWQALTRATAKLRAVLGMIVTSEAVDGLGEHTEESSETIRDQAGNEIQLPSGPRYKVNLGGTGPFKLELDPGDDVKFLKDNSPSEETFQFFKSAIGFALKSLDLPLSFYDEGLTNFFGQRAALILYLKSCLTKRRNLVSNVLSPLTKWLLVRWVASGRLRLPANGDLSKVPFSWHADGTPYWNPSQEVNADIQAIQAGLALHEDVYLERTGRDWYRDMLRKKKEQEFLIKNAIMLDPKVMQFIPVGSDPGSNPLASLPIGGLAL